MADGFLGRWSQRKQEVRQGRPLEEPAAAAAVAEPAPAHVPQASQAAVVNQTPSAPAAVAPQAPAPTLKDVQALTTQSDFKPFMARDVDPEVKNAAMKKLFTDPHYNLMDGLDTYIDDYSKPDPLPESMLRQMVSAKFLNLFDDEKTENAQPSVRDNTGSIATPVAQAASPSQEPGDRPADPREPVPPAAPQITTQDHAHTDLRLQQDHATGPQGPGRGTQ
jgi:hypothetical protein